MVYVVKFNYISWDVKNVMLNILCRKEIVVLNYLV